ncbi:heat shock protein 9/12-domain-containing protein, partial [Fomes fomentarius]
MSDAGRQSFTDKATAALKPDSEKSTTEHMGDKFKGNADSVASTLQPQGGKSTSQKAGDALSSNSNHSTEPSLAQKAKNAVGLGNNN